MAYDSGKITYILQTSGLDKAQQQSQSINKNMAEAAVSSSKIGKAAGGALGSTSKGTFGESVAYGNARGNTGQTGASSRDFANQAQGLGGLVRLYATFAANIFAVGMAFEALKRSFQFEQLQRASEAFAISSGRSLGGLAADLKKLSQGVLSDKAAQQMANYGSSAGFTTDQMKRMIGVARGASQALGRDMGDAIDRLMRGTGKLEPELLDELGLLTRTKVAATEYGKSIGKTFEQLTQFEKTQGFINAVLKEGEEKFGAVSKAVNASPFERFTAALLTMGTTVGNIFNKVFVPILDFFSNNPTAMIAAMAAAFGKLLMTALPALSQLGQGAKAAAEKQAASFTDMQDRAKTAYKDMATAAITRNDVMARAAFELSENQKARLDEIVEHQKTAAAKQIATSNKTNDTLKKIAKDGLVDQATLNRSIAQLESSGTNPKTLAFLKEQNALQKEHNEGAVYYQGKIKEINDLYSKSIQIEKEGVLTAGAMNSLLQKRAELSSTRATGLATVEEVARVGTYKQAFSTLGIVMDTVRAKHIELYGAGGMWTKAASMIAVANTAVAGTFRIATAAAATFLSTIGIWIGVITLAGAAIAGLISVFGGFSDVIDSLKTSQDSFSNTLKVVGQQSVLFLNLQLAVDNTASSFVRMQQYSSNALGGIAEGLQATTKLFSEFLNESSGGWTRFVESLKSTVGWDTATKQAEQLRSSIYAALSLSSPAEKEKIKTAILASLPGAKDIEQVVGSLSSMSNAALDIFGKQLASNLADVNKELIQSTQTLKSAEGSWKSLGEAVDKYNEKEKVQDPKLKGIVSSLESINAAYRSAKTEKDKALVLSNLDITVQEKLKKLAEERGIAIKEWLTWINNARAASAEYAQEEINAARKKKEDLIESARASVAEQNGAKEALISLAELQKKLTENKYDGAKLEKAGDMSSYISAASNVSKAYEQAIKNTKDLSQKAYLEGEKLIFDRVTTEFLNSLKPKAKQAAEAALAEFEKVLAGNKLFSRTVSGMISSGVVLGTNSTSGYDGEGTGVKPPRNPGERLSTSFSDVKAEKERKNHERISKYLEYQVQAQAAIEAMLRRTADVEKEIVGYISESTAAKIEQATIDLAGLNYAKRIAELNKEEKDKQKGNAEERRQAAEDRALGIRAALETKNTAAEIAAITMRQTAIQREKVRLEEETISFQKLSLDIQGQINELYERNYLTSTKQANINKAEINSALAMLDITKREADLAEKVKQALAFGPPDPQIMATLNAKKDILEIDKQRIGLTKQITIEEAKQKAFWERLAIINNAIGSVLGSQLALYVQIGTAAANTLKVRTSELIMGAEIAKAYQTQIAAAGILENSADGQLLKEQALLDLTQKIYAQRVKLYELTSRDGSGANFMQQIGQGFEIEAQKFKESIKSAVQTVVDGAISAADASIDYVMEKLKTGGKINLKEFTKSITDSLKNSLFDYASNTMKSFARNMLAAVFGGGQLTVQQAMQRASETFQAGTVVTKDLNSTMRDLIDALNANKPSIMSSTNSSGSVPFLDGTTLDGWSSTVEDSTSVIEDWGTSVEDGNRVIMDAGESVSSFSVKTDAAGSTLLGWAQKLWSSVGGGSGASVGSAISGAIGGGVGGNMLGSIGSSLASSAVMGAGSAFISGFGAGYAGTIGMVAAGGEFVAGTGAALMAGLEVGLAAIPVAGWVALAAIIVYSIVSGMEDGPAMRKGMWAQSGITDADNANQGQIGKSAFGTFGVQSSNWFSDSMNPEFKKLNDSITLIDNSISKLIGKTATTNVTTALKNAGAKSYDFGMEETNFTETGIVGKLLTDRYHIVLDTIGEGLGKLLDNFEGTGSELGKFILEIISMNTALQDTAAITAVFGQSITVDMLIPLQEEGESITQTFSRVSREFLLTDAIANSLGVNVVDAFGGIGLAGLAARENLIGLAGGLEALTAKSTYFYENFYTAEERHSKTVASATKVLNDGFGALNMAVPASREAYRTAVANALAAGNMELYNKLLDLSSAFITANDSADGAAGAISTLTKDTKTLNESMALMGVTLSEEVVTALQSANIDLQEFGNNVSNFAKEMLTSAQQSGYALEMANKTIDKNFGAGKNPYGIARPTTRQELVGLWEATKGNEVVHAWLVQFWKEFDTVFDSEDRLHEVTVKLNAGLSSLGITMTDELTQGLLDAGVSLDTFLSDVEGFNKRFLKLDDKGALALARSKVAAGFPGETAPTSAADYAKMVSESTDPAWTAFLVSWWKDFDIIFTAEDKLRENTAKLNASFEQFGVTLTTDMIESLNAAGLSLDKFLSDMDGFSKRFLSLDDAGALAVARSNVNSKFPGGLANAPTSAADYAKMVTASLTDTSEAGLKWTAFLVSFYKDFDVIFTAEDKLRENTVKLNASFEQFGITLTTDMIESLNTAGLSLDKFLSDMDGFTKRFLSLDDAGALAVARSNVNSKFPGGLANAPTSAADYAKMVTASLTDTSEAGLKWTAFLVSFYKDFDVIFTAEDKLRESTIKLNEQFSKFGITLSQDMIDALKTVEGGLDKFQTDLAGFSERFEKMDETGALAVSKAKIKGVFGDNGPTSGADYAKMVRESMADQTAAGIKWTAFLVSFWKDFDIIFSAEEKATKVAVDLSRAFSDLGISISSDLMPGLIEAAGGVDTLTSQLEFYNSKFLNNKLTKQGARDTIAASGLTNAPQSRAAFVAMMNSAIVTPAQKVLLLKLAPAFDVIYEDAENLAELFKGKLSTAISALYTDQEERSISLAEANRTLASSTDILKKGVKTTNEEFWAAYDAALAIGDTDLAERLLDLAPAIGIVRDAVFEITKAFEDAADRINGATRSLMDEVEDSMLSTEQKYEKYKKKSEDASAELDVLKTMDAEGLKAKIRDGSLSAESVAKITESAVANAQTAWNTLDDTQKKAMGGDFLKYVEQLKYNSLAILDKIKPLVDQVAGESPTVGTVPGSTAVAGGAGTSSGTAGTASTTSNTAPPTVSDPGPQALSSGVVEGSIAGGVAIKDSIVLGSTTAAWNMRAGIVDGGSTAGEALKASLVASIASINIAFNPPTTMVDDLGEVMASHIDEQRQEIGRQKSEMEAVAAKFLEAAAAMQQAAVDQLIAAQTPKEINVNVETQPTAGFITPELGPSAR